MKTTITFESLQDIARELAFAESSRYDTERAGLSSTCEYWDAKCYGLKRACKVFLGSWPAVYYVPACGVPDVVFPVPDSSGRDYVVVWFAPTTSIGDGIEYHIDADTFEFLAF